MPHKRNPQLSDDCITIGAQLRALVPLALEGMLHDHEVDGAHSAMLDDALERACVLTGDLLVTQRSYRDVSWLLSYAGLVALFNADSPFDVLIDLARPCLAEELILRYVSGNVASGDRDALRGIGRLARTTYIESNNVALVELSWLLQSKIGESIKKSHFLNTPELGAENGYYDRYWGGGGMDDKPCEESDLDVILGAAAVLCVFAECENWDMQDLSADRLASLALGPVGGLQGIFLMRYGGEDLSVKHLRARTGLGPTDIELLLAWAENAISFTYGFARDQ